MRGEWVAKRSRATGVMPLGSSDVQKQVEGSCFSLVLEHMKRATQDKAGRNRWRNQLDWVSGAPNRFRQSQKLDRKAMPRGSSVVIDLTDLGALHIFWTLEVEVTVPFWFPLLMGIKLAKCSQENPSLHGLGVQAPLDCAVPHPRGWLREQPVPAGSAVTTTCLLLL